MRRGFRLVVLLVLLALAYLAIRPYWPKIAGEAELLYTTWQQARNGQVAKTLPVDPESATAQQTSARSRELRIPEPTTTVSNAPNNDKQDADLFIQEIRQRAEKNPTAAMEWLQSQRSGSERLRGMLEVVALWAAEDSEAALLWLESNAQGLARMETLSSGIALWAERKPTEAAKWVEGMANDGSKVTAAKALASNWVHSDPEAAAAWVSALPNGSIRQEASEALLAAWMQDDAKAASVWALSEAEFKGNYQLLGESIRAFSKQSPQEAESFVRDMVDSTQGQRALAAYVTGRAQKDPAATAAWLTELSPEDPIYATEHANLLMQVWAESDSIAASEWLSQQPAGTQRDAAAYGFSESIQRYEPEAAAIWANAIDDADRRMLRLTDSISQWARSRPHQALEWVKSAELEPTVRTHLANQIGAD